MMKKRFYFAAALILFLLPVFAGCEKRKYNLPEKILTIQTEAGDVKVKAELAIKQEERNYGFMNRKKIPEGTGMLFVFEKDQQLSFWMKNTPTALSIAYIDSTGIIRDIYDMTPYSLSDVTSTRSVRYALEVPQGWYKKAGVKIGDRLVKDF